MVGRREAKRKRVVRCAVAMVGEECRMKDQKGSEL